MIFSGCSHRFYIDLYFFKKVSHQDGLGIFPITGFIFLKNESSTQRSWERLHQQLFLCPLFLPQMFNPCAHITETTADGERKLQVKDLFSLSQWIKPGFHF